MKPLLCPHCGKDIYQPIDKDVFKTRQGRLILVQYKKYYDEGFEDGYSGTPKDEAYQSSYYEMLYQEGFVDGCISR